MGMMLYLQTKLWLRCKTLCLRVLNARLTQKGSDPLRLSMFLLDACRKRGVQVHQPATPICLTTDSSNTITSLTIKLNDNSETQSKSPIPHSNPATTKS
jgi:hypothetical protein